jgi:hypothetical protein
MSPNSKYAIRVNVGNVNAISGLSIQEVAERQDYVVVPGQPWLDGIAVEPGVVRQFVAMPCKSKPCVQTLCSSMATKETTSSVGGGYTVEGQIAGKEKFGGIQIEVVPSYQNINTMSFSYEIEKGRRRQIAEAQTPRDCGLEGGSKIAMMPYPPTFSRIARLRDFYDGEIAGEGQYLVLKVSLSVCDESSTDCY